MPIKQEDHKEKVVLVDNKNRYLGLMDKLKAHQEGALHKAFSIFIFNSKSELLMQKRAACKYHSPHQWANTCCGHPRKDEATLNAAKRRLYEEMGLDVPLLEDIQFTYRANLQHNLIEHEVVQFFIGKTNTQPLLNPYEASDSLWISETDLFENPQNLDFAPWFQIYLTTYKNAVKELFEKSVNGNIISNLS